MPTQHGAPSLALGSIAVVISLVAAVPVVPIVSGVVPTAAASGTPDVQLTRAVAASSLYGVDVPVTLTAHQDSTPDQDAFNLTFTDIIPPHTSFGSGAIAPTRTMALPDGSTELVWSNVADLLDNTSFALSYQLHYDPAFFDVP
jgi:hypothetical protein